MHLELFTTKLKMIALIGVFLFLAFNMETRIWLWQENMLSSIPVHLSTWLQLLTLSKSCPTLAKNLLNSNTSKVSNVQMPNGIRYQIFILHLETEQVLLRLIHIQFQKQIGFKKMEEFVLWNLCKILSWKIIGFWVSTFSKTTLSSSKCLMNNINKEELEFNSRKIMAWITTQTPSKIKRPTALLTTHKIYKVLKISNIVGNQASNTTLLKTHAKTEAFQMEHILPNFCFSSLLVVTDQLLFFEIKN